MFKQIKQQTGATSVVPGDTLQTLWSGYGKIVRVHLQGCDCASAILKIIDPPQDPAHPRGWNTSESHSRKLHSYRVEISWYQDYAQSCDDACKVPALLASGAEGNQRWLLLEDLDRNFPLRRSELAFDEVRLCLHWLAEFHARFLGVTADGLWPTGCYWHLATRQHEFSVMQDGPLKRRAGALDHALENCRYKTLVHGDAKVANFCFSADMTRVAAVDFQYVGGGAGIRDVVYLLGSCIAETELSTREEELLAIYFTRLHEALLARATAEVADDVIHVWRELYAIAWTDFYRFLAGWMPTHSKITGYTRALAQRAFVQLPRH